METGESVAEKIAREAHIRELPGKRKYAALTDAQLLGELKAMEKRVVAELRSRKSYRWRQTNVPPGNGDARETREEREHREALR